MAFDKVLDLERKAQAPVLDFFKNKAPQAFENVLNFERKIQKDVVNFFKKEVNQVKDLVESPPVPPPTSIPGVNVVLSPIEINGFYLLTGNNYVTFYATTNNPTRNTINEGWTPTGITGLAGQLVVSGEADLNSTMQSRVVAIPGAKSESYVWSFRIQSDTEQAIAPYQYVTGAVLYPPGQIDYTSLKRKGTITGYYDVIQHVTKYTFSEEPPAGFGVGWRVEDLAGFDGPLRVVSYTDLIMKSWIDGLLTPTREMFAILTPIDGSIPENTSAPVRTKATVKEPSFTTTFVPANFTNYDKSMATSLQKFQIEIDQSVRGGASMVPLRDLNTGFKYENQEVGPMSDVTGRGLSSGSVMALHAIGPQEDHLLLEDFSKSSGVLNSNATQTP